MQEQLKKEAGTLYKKKKSTMWNIEHNSMHHNTVHLIQFDSYLLSNFISLVN